MVSQKSILAVAISLCFSSSVYAENPVQQAPDEFNFNEPGTFAKDLGNSVTINIPDTFDQVFNYDNGAGIHAGGNNKTAEKTKVLLTGKNLDIVFNKDNLWQTGIDAFGDSELTLGTAENSFENINILGSGPDTAIGLQVWRGHGNNVQENGGHLTINSKSLNIDVTSPYAKGIYVWNNTTPDSIGDKERSSVHINADTVRIVAKTDKSVEQYGTSRAIQVWSQGIVDIKAKDVYLEADELINTRGNSNITIRGSNSTQLKGDVRFQYDAVQSGTTVDSSVDIALDGVNSYWEGSALYSYNKKPTDENKEKISGMKLSITNGAQWTPRLVEDQENLAQVAINDLTLDGGIINVNHGADQKVKVDTLKGKGGTIRLAGELQGKAISTGTLTVANPTQSNMALDVTVTGLTADDIKDADAALASLEGKVVASGSTITNTVQEGDITGALSQTIDKNGNKSEIKKEVNQKLDGYSSIAALSAVQWRHETDTLLKRMGELRDAEGTVGAWARIYGSEQEYGAQSVKAKNTTIQVGSDYDIGAGWKVGGAFSYTDGSSTFDRGQSDNKMYGLSLYGTYLADNGLFVDLIGKYSRLSNDFTSGTMKGDFDNNAFSIAAETGWHYAFNTLGFVEPSVGVTYGRIMGDDFVADNGVKVEQDDYDSLIGRVGVRGGFYFPEQKGNIYARVAVLHDFMGDMEATASKYNKVTGLNTSHLKEELGDTWIEYGIGANFKLAKNAYTFVDLEKTAGSDVKENWKWTIGARYAF